MSGPAFHAQMRANGHTVVTGHRYVVIEIDGRVLNIDSDGEPIDVGENAVTYAPANKSHKIYHGPTAASVKGKINGYIPDIDHTVQE